MSMTPQSAQARHSFFCPCPRGLEVHLAEELNEIAALDKTPSLKVHQQVPGGVHCSGMLSDSWRINLHSRLASRVLLRLHHGAYKNENDIYDAVLAQEWESWFTVDDTIRVDVTAIKSPVRSLEFVTLKIKDGICDRFRDLYQQRPSVDTNAPDMRVVGFLDAHTFTLYLDTSGDALFKRGWREETGEAPLRENLAAGLLRCAGWKPGMALFDPMCGSGTILIEAAQMHAGIPSGWHRRFAFEKFQGFESDVWHSCRTAATPPTNVPTPNISGSDISGDMVVATLHNVKIAGIPFDIPVKQIEAQVVKAPELLPEQKAILLTNPPYGERIGVRGDSTLHNDELLHSFFTAFGNTLKQRFSGWEAYLFSADRELPRLLRLKESRKTPLFNGPLECRLFRFDMVAGFNRRPAAIPDAKTE